MERHRGVLDRQHGGCHPVRGQVFDEFEYWLAARTADGRESIGHHESAQVAAHFAPHSGALTRMKPPAVATDPEESFAGESSKRQDAAGFTDVLYRRPGSRPVTRTRSTLVPNETRPPFFG